MSEMSSIDIVSPPPPSIVLEEAEEDEFVDRMNSDFGTLYVPESVSIDDDGRGHHGHHQPLPPSTSMSVSMSSMANGATPGGDDAYWICNECTFRNNGRISSHRCTLCDGKRGDDAMQELMTPTFGGDLDDDVGDDEDDDDGAAVVVEEPFGVEVDGVDAEWFGVGVGASERGTATLEHFECALSVVVGHAPSHKAAITVLKSLNKITQRVSDEKPKYRVLDVRSEGVQSKFSEYTLCLDPLWNSLTFDDRNLLNYAV